MSVAAVRLSDYNVRINIPSVADKAAAAEIHQSSAADLVRAQALLEEIEAAAKEFLP